MRTTVFAFSFVVVLGSVGWNCSMAMASNSQPETYGLPPKLSSLTDLQPVARRTDIDSVEKTEILFLWLKEERKQPTPTSKGLGGGDINSSYIQLMFRLKWQSATIMRYSRLPRG